MRCFLRETTGSLQVAFSTYNLDLARAADSAPWFGDRFRQWYQCQVFELNKANKCFVRVFRNANDGTVWYCLNLVPVAARMDP